MLNTLLASSLFRCIDCWLHGQLIVHFQLDCKPLQLWLLSRHGTRHPAASVIGKIASLTYYKNQIIENSTLCQADLEAIKKWDFNLTEKDGNKLNSQGVDDLLSLGLKFKNLYPDIFNEPYNPETFKVIKAHAINTKLM